MQPESRNPGQNPQLSRDGGTRLVRLYYGYQLFFSLLVWLPIFYEYQKRIGLNDLQIFSIQSIYYVVFCLFEIPTGMIADRWGHRRCLRAGAVVLTLSNLLPIFFQSYQGFLWHFILIALSRSLISGASSAYLYDHLAHMGRVAEYKIVEGRARAYGLVGKIFFWAFVGSLMAWHLTLPYWLTAVCSALSVAFAWALPKQVTAGTTRRSGSPLEVLVGLKDAILTLARTPILFWIMLQGIAIFTLGRICQVNLFQPILGSKAFGLASYGLIMSAMTVFEAIGSATPGWIRRLFSDLNAVFILTVVMALSLALIPWVGAFGTIALLCVFAWTTGIAFPIQKQLLNDAIVDSSRRATLMSIESIIDRSVCAWVASLLGQAMSGNGLDYFLVASALATFGSVVVLYPILRSGRPAAIAVPGTGKELV